MSKLKQNIQKLYIGQFLSEMTFFIPIMVPFFGGLGFSMQQILILEAAFAVTLVILEIPSGYIADLYGRKNALIIGSLIELTGVTIFVFSNAFLGFLIGEIILGIGASLVSGSGEAMLYDTLLELKAENRYKKLQGNMFFSGRVAAIVAGIAGAFLANYFLRLPFYITLVPYLLWVLVNFTLIEPHRHKSKMETWPHFKKILKEAFRDAKLRYFILYAAIPSGLFLMAFWLNQRYLEFVELPIFYFGIFFAAMNLFSGLGGKFTKEIEERISPKGSLILVPLVAIMAWIMMGSIQSIWSIPLMLIVSSLWGFTMPLFHDFIQRMTTSDRRATVLSIRSFLTRLIFFIFAPFLGWITDLYSIQEAYLMSAVLMLTLGGVSLMLLRKVGIL